MVHQDFTVPLKTVHEMWAKGKMSDDAAKQEILASKSVGAERMLRVLNFHQAEEKKAKLEKLALRTLEQIQERQHKFRSDPIIDEWLKQFAQVHKSPCHRYVSLLLRGESQTGKTAMAVSLFGSSRTLVVNCQGCSPNLPSILEFDRDEHSAIVWDEIDEKQVLNNKLVFQAGAHLVTLGQSKCNQYSYGRFLHGVAMILCSNTFVMPGVGRATNLPDVDEDWLVKNVREVALPPGEVWYLQSPPRPVSHSGEQAALQVG